MRIFVSYRREDSAGYAGRLHDRLVQHFGADSIFMDIDTIEPGQDFVEAVGDAVGSCDVLIALIGQQWLSVTDSAGVRRLDDPHDFIHLEVSTALDRKIRVIPALVRGTKMPGAADLPDSLKMLSRRQAVEITDQRFHSDVDRLIEAIEKVLDQNVAQPTSAPPPKPVAAQPEPTSPPPPPPTAQAPAASRDTIFDPVVARYASMGYVEETRTDKMVVMTQRAPLNVILLIGYVLAFWPLAIFHILEGSRKQFRLVLQAGPGGTVEESGDTPTVIEEHKKKVTRNGWILIGGAVVVAGCFLVITMAGALSSY